MKLINVNTVILAVLATSMLVVFAGYSSNAARSVDSDCFNHGDVNLDGAITAADAQLAFFIVLGLHSPSYEEECAADCNGDGIVTAADAQAIFLVVLGLDECSDPLIPVPFEVYISPGTYTRGSPADEPCPGSSEGPQHTVTLTRGFYMMTTEVTLQMWTDLKASQPTLPDDPSDPSVSPTMSHPIQQNTWFESVLFANLMSLQDGYTRCYYKDEGFTIPVNATNYTTGDFYCNFNANGYRLPTEAEWEYACRAGTTGSFSCSEPDYDSGNCESCTAGTHPALEQYCVYCASTPGGSMIVGSKLANPWGLYDMHGNICEWCWDWYSDYPSEPVTDPLGHPTGWNRVLRSGSWAYYARSCRSAYRLHDTPDNRLNTKGFRLVRTVS